MSEPLQLPLQRFNHWLQQQPDAVWLRQPVAGVWHDFTWRQVDEHLAAQGPYLLGESRSVADFMLTMLMRWSRNMPRPAHDWPALAAHAARMKALPSFAEAYRREGITDWA